jgi:predicted nucleotidyltransferase
MHNFSQLLARLADAGLDFVIVGGFAAVSHGSAYITKDVDICVVLSDETVETLRGALRDLHPFHRMTPQKLSFLVEPPAGQSVQNLYLHTDWGMVDVLSSVLGVGDFSRLRERSELIAVDGREYHVMSLSDLIAAKEALGREKDLLTAKELRAIAAKRGKSVS